MQNSVQTGTELATNIIILTSTNHILQKFWRHLTLDEYRNLDIAGVCLCQQYPSGGFGDCIAILPIYIWSDTSSMCVLNAAAEGERRIKLNSLVIAILSLFTSHVVEIIWRCLLAFMTLSTSMLVRSISDWFSQGLSHQSLINGLWLDWKLKSMTHEMISAFLLSTSNFWAVTDHLPLLWRIYGSDDTLYKGLFYVHFKNRGILLTTKTVQIGLCLRII